MKNTYVKPEMAIEKFMADHNVAEDCSKKPGGRTIYFVCDAGNKGTNYAIKDASGNAKRISGYSRYHPCGTTHTFNLTGNQKLSDRTDIITGLHLDNPNTWGDENISVTIWTDNGTDVHCTTIINPEEWDTSKS